MSDLASARSPEMAEQIDDVETCEGCGTPVPDWPAGWLFTDDGHNFCPRCKGNVTLLRKRG